MNDSVLRKPAYILLLLLSLLILNAPVYSDDSNINNPLGFKFGMSSKRAKKLIGDNGNQIIKNEVDSKKIRTVLFDGVIVEYPYLDEADKKTRLEFYNDRLMSTSLVVKNLRGVRFTEVQNTFITNIETDFGEPDSKDHMLSYNIWTWKRPDVKLILSSNRNKGEVKLEYTYMPIARSKAERELEAKRKGEETRNPADQMFKDGNYSQQGAPINKY